MAYSKRVHRRFLEMPAAIRSYIQKIPENYQKPGFLVTCMDVVYSRLRYGSGIEDYFLYRFYSLNHIGRKSFATERDKFAIATKVNDPNYKARTEDKSVFYQYYGHLMKREVVLLLPDSVDDLLLSFVSRTKEQGWDRIIFKPYNGEGGLGTFDLSVDDPVLQGIHSLFKYYHTILAKEALRLPHFKDKIENKMNKLVAEPVIENHISLKKVYPTSLNTVRVVTLRKKDGYHILGAYMRFGSGGSIVDNISHGGMCAEIDLNSGIIITPAVNGEGTEFFVHPDTGESIIGLKMPFWEECKSVALEACKVTPQLGYLCWDLAITPKGVSLIEGNSLGGVQIQQWASHQGKRYLYKDVL